MLLGEAYDDGLGIDKNPRERLRAWREAARLGSLEAKAKLARAFIFDFSDRLLTLREGITGRIALYIDGVGGTGTSIGAQFAGLFSGPRASDAGAAALAEAVMDAFREAPAGLEEQTLVNIGKALPDEIRIAVEQRLKADGFYAGEPKGYFGPEPRKALAAWVDAKGPLGDIAEPPAVGELQQGEDAVATEIIDRLRDRAFELGMAAKTDDERLEALKLLNALARYGDIAPRWALVRNYHQAKVVRSVVTPAEIVRYALDLLVTRPPSVKKAEFEFALDLAQIAEDGKFDAVGDATLAAIRDDPRLHDPLTLGGIMRAIHHVRAARLRRRSRCGQEGRHPRPRLRWLRGRHARRAHPVCQGTGARGRRCRRPQGRGAGNKVAGRAGRQIAQGVRDTRRGRVRTSRTA